MDILTTIPAPLHESAHSLWYPSTISQAFTFAPSTNTLTTHPQSQEAAQQAQQQHSQQRHATRATSRTFLSHLRVDEHAITVRRANIRRFGAGWLKPPGIGKTMQGLWDEQAEREEAEAAAQREAALAEAQAAAEALAGDGGAIGEADEEAHAERDLDDDIPDAEEETGEWMDSEGEEDALPTHEVDGDFAPDGVRMSIIGDGAGDIMVRDLDDDVPDAGSYQHTDTDVEDSSSVEDESGRGRSSIGMASVVGFAGLGSSPMPPTGRR